VNILIPDAYASRSRFGRADPRAKLLAVLLLISAVALLRSPVATGAALLLALGLLAVSRLPLNHTATTALPLVMLLVGVGLGSWFSASAEQALVQTGRVGAAGLGALWLGLTTPLVRLLEGLRRLGLPRSLVLLGLFMARYLVLLQEEAQSMRSARRARGISRGRGLRDTGALRRVGLLVGELLVRAHRRGLRVEAALRSRVARRGVVWASAPAWRGRDTLLLLSAIVATAALLGLDRGWGWLWL